MWFLPSSGGESPSFGTHEPGRFKIINRPLSVPLFRLLLCEAHYIMPKTNAQIRICKMCVVFFPLFVFIMRFVCFASLHSTEDHIYSCK